VTKNKRRVLYYQKLVEAGFDYKTARFLRDRSLSKINYAIELKQSPHDADKEALQQFLLMLGCHYESN
jgi:hypothetical protein